MKPRDDEPALHWAKGKSKRALSLLKGRLRLVAIREGDDDFALYSLPGTPGSQPTPIECFPTMRQAQCAGEVRAERRSQVDHLARIGEKWREEDATPGQLYRMKRIRINPSPRMSKGEASDKLVIIEVTAAMEDYYAAGGNEGRGPCL